MAEPTPPEAAPQAAEAPAAAPDAATGKNDKFVAMGTCPHCGEHKTVSHRQWCQKNPNRRTVTIKRGEGKAKPKAPAKQTAKPAAAKPKAKPKAPAATGQEAFLRERSAELRGDAGKAPATKPDEPTPPPTPPAKKTEAMTWVVLGIFFLGLGLLIWRLTQPSGKKPRDDGPDDQPQLEANAQIPGVGAVHIPGLTGPPGSA